MTSVQVYACHAERLYLEWKWTPTTKASSIPESDEFATVLGFHIKIIVQNGKRNDHFHQKLSFLCEEQSNNIGNSSWMVLFVNQLTLIKRLNFGALEHINKDILETLNFQHVTPGHASRRDGKPTGSNLPMRMWLSRQSFIHEYW